jgi:hypothetical protein
MNVTLFINEAIIGMSNIGFKFHFFLQRIEKQIPALYLSVRIAKDMHR